MSVSLPDMNQVVKKMNGRVLPLGWLRFLLGRGSVDAIPLLDPMAVAAEESVAVALGRRPLPS